MNISYAKLWKLLIDKNMSKTDLRIATKMSTSTLSRLGKNEAVSMDIIMRICETLHCDVSEVMEVFESESTEQEKHL